MRLPKHKRAGLHATQDVKKKNPTLRMGFFFFGSPCWTRTNMGAGFDMDLTARENIYLNGTVLGFSPKYLDEKFDEIVEFSELQNFLDVPLKNYSSGMVARIGFAIATITKPDILIADEVLSVGDFLFQQKCEKRMQELMAGGTTVILVSHSIEQIERMCSKVAWLSHGHLKMNGDTATVCAAYKATQRGEA